MLLVANSILILLILLAPVFQYQVYKKPVVVTICMNKCNYGSKELMINVIRLLLLNYMQIKNDVPLFWPNTVCLMFQELIIVVQNFKESVNTSYLTQIQMGALVVRKILKTLKRVRLMIQSTKSQTIIRSMNIQMP